MSDRISYRMKFEKKGRLRFIGHLDLLNVFQRAMKRGQLPIAYSLGFNPHQEISFALPLSLGHESAGDYLDAIFSQPMAGADIASALNGALPEGLTVLFARPLRQGEKNSAAVIRAARYEARLPEEAKISEGIINDFLALKEIPMEKKSKKKTAIVDIRPMIYTLSIKDNTVDMMIAAGSMDNLKAEALIQMLYAEGNIAYNPLRVQYKRVEMYSEGVGGDFVPLYQ